MTPLDSWKRTETLSRQIWSGFDWLRASLQTYDWLRGARGGVTEGLTLCVLVGLFARQVEMLQQSKNEFINVLYPPGKTVCWWRGGAGGGVCAGERECVCW